MMQDKPTANLVKMLAIIFLFLVLLASLIVAAYDLVTRRALSPEIQTVLSLGVGYCLTLGGIHSGVSLANGVAKDTAAAVVRAQTQPLAEPPGNAP
jgi:hypothetical protein